MFPGGVLEEVSVVVFAGKLLLEVKACGSWPKFFTGRATRQPNDPALTVCTSSIVKLLC